MFFGRKRREEQNDEPNYWISFTDFALSFLLTFILLSSLMLVYQHNQRVAAEKSKEEYAKRIKDIEETYAVREHIAKKLAEAFADDPRVDVDPISGRVLLKENVIEFYPDSSVLKSDASFINNFFVKYINAIKSAESPNKEIKYYDDYVQRIIIEGHINKVNEYTTGMKLSQDRALTVYNQIYNLIENEDELLKKVQAVGRGRFSPYENASSESANRRVEFHFTLDEEKIVKEQYQAMRDAEEKANAKGSGS